MHKGTCMHTHNYAHIFVKSGSIYVKLKTKKISGPIPHISSNTFD